MPNWLIVMVSISILIALGAISFYVYTFPNTLSNKQEVWGQFGDFIGGTLNPLFALTALFALLYTVHQQSIELRASSEQLKNSANALQTQNQTLEKQNFEDTFFQLLRLFGEIIKDLNYVERDMMSTIRGGNSSVTEYHDRRCLSRLYQVLKNSYNNNKPSDIVDFNSDDKRQFYNDLYESFYKEHGHHIGHYFRMLYNVIKFVDRSEFNDEFKKVYTNLIRSQLSRDELALLFYNCLSEYGNEKLLPLVMKHKLMKHLEVGIIFDPTDIELSRDSLLD